MRMQMWLLSITTTALCGYHFYVTTFAYLDVRLLTAIRAVFVVTGGKIAQLTTYKVIGILNLFERFELSLCLFLELILNDFEIIFFFIIIIIKKSFSV
jgi:hypothetical protein